MLMGVGWAGLGWAVHGEGCRWGCRRLSRAAVVCAHAVHMPHLHRAATVVLAVEQHRLSCRSAGLKGEEAGTCACSVEPVYFQPLSKARKLVQAAAYHALGPTWRCHHSLLQESWGLGRRC